MTLDLQQQAQRRMRRAVVTLSAIVLVLVAALVVVAVSGDDSGDSKTAAPPEQTTAAPEPTTTLPADDGDYVAPARYVKLPNGRGDANGLPVKFPHTPEGATAMLVASARNAWSFDAATVRAGILTYASAEYRDAMAASAKDGAAGNREYAGIPATGEIPAGASLTAWPIGVKWSSAGSDTVDAVILLRVTHTAKAGVEPTTTLVVSPARAVWESGDWKVQPTDPTQNIPDPVDLGTAEFNEDGWKAIQEGDRL